MISPNSTPIRSECPPAKIPGDAPAHPMDLAIQPLVPVVGELSLPGDKSISLRMAVLAGLASGPSCLRNFPFHHDCRALLRILSQIGVEHEELKPGTLTIFGRGGEFSPPAGPLECGNCGTTARLLMGLLAAQPFAVVIDGDATLRKLPLNAEAAVLRRFGARVDFLGKDGHLPIRLQGRGLSAQRFEFAVADDALKGVLFLAGLQAEGETVLQEQSLTRDHTERALALAGVGVERRGHVVRLRGRQIPGCFDVTLPGDIFCSAFWLALAAPVEGSRVIIRDVSLNHHRLGFVDALIHMGAGVREEVLTCDNREWFGHLDVRGRCLQPLHVTPELVPSLADEIPLLAVVAAKAEGVSTIRGAQRLRRGEVDLLAATASNLQRMGVKVDECADGLTIHGTAHLHGADLDSYGVPEIAMSFAVAGLLAEGDSLIRGAACIALSYPEFTSHWKHLVQSTVRERVAEQR